VDEKRLTEVETRYAFLERLVEELSQVVHQQQRTIDTVIDRLNRIEKLVDRALDEFGEELPHEKPPHY
jgi:SlyX protein